MHEDSQVGHQRCCCWLHHQRMKGLEWALGSACSAEELSTVQSSILLWAAFDIAGERELVQQWEQVSREWRQLERTKLEQSGTLKVMEDSQDEQEEVQMTQIHLPHELAAVKDKSSPGSFLLSYPHHLLMSSSLRRPSLASPPSKRAKQAPPSPPAPPRPSTPAVVPPVPVQTKPGVSDAHELSVFDILNIFRSRWFLNRDHLIANVLSAQKSDEGRYSWVDFQPPFHTHLVQHARALLPPLCPVAKGKKVMFVFILEVLDGDGPKSGSFWEVPKKRRRRPTLPKKPDEKPEASPSASEALVESLLASTSPAVPEPSGHEMMTGVMPSVPIDLPPPVPTPGPPVPPTAPARAAPREETLAESLTLVPFPREYAQPGIVRWGDR